MCHNFPPLAQRVYRSKSRIHTDLHTSLQRPPEYKQWSEAQMTQAYSAVINDGLSVRRSALEYDVPRSTLGDRVSGKVLDGSKSGKKRYLSDEEEEELVKFLINCAAVGFPRSRMQVISMVQEVCNKRNIDAVVSHGWWERFCGRHPNVSLRSCAVLSQARARGTNPEAIDEYFDILEQTLTEYDLLDKPGNIFNMDETGMPIDPKSLKVVAAKGTKNPTRVTSGSKSQITVVGCISAAGFAIPPMVVWDRKTLHRDMSSGEVPGTLHAMTHSGWMDQDLFETWLCCHFLRYAPPVRPLLLLMDGHTSHYCPEAIRLAARQEVILFTLPPNTTHVSQPLDRTCFGPLKMSWRKVCQDYVTKNPEKVVTRFSFCALFAEAWKCSMTMHNIITGFEATGIYPLDRSKLKQAPIKDVTDQTGLTYLPLLSPAPKRKEGTPFVPSFSGEEMVRFHQRYQGDCHLDEDERYHLWLDMYQPEVESEEQTSMEDCFIHTPVKKGNTRAKVALLAKPHSGLQHMFKCPSPPKPRVMEQPKRSCRVLTSAENLKNLDEKQRKKDEALQKKQRRKENKKNSAHVEGSKFKACKPGSPEPQHTDSDIFSSPVCPPQDQAKLLKEKKMKETAPAQVPKRGVTSGVTTRSKSKPVEPMTMAPAFVDDDYPTSVSTWINELGLSGDDREILKSGQWLTANHISAAQSLLRKAHPLQNGLCDTSYLTDRLQWPSVANNFVQIIHVGGAHWACVSNRFCEEDETHVVELFDSLHTTPGDSIKEQVCTMLHCEKSFLTIRVINVQQQTTGDSCGLFAIAMAQDICNGRDPFVSTYKEKEMRHHVEKCFDSRNLTNFPDDKSKARPRRKRVCISVDVELYCVCRYPDLEVTSRFGDMACCDRCELWYHAICMDIPSDVFTKKRQKWVCAQCK